ncbi:MAG: nicotinate-nucleotide adenylyltransferase [Oscillospiraceae bacterium]|nr:nicotinate-nucleotide adenylyltransferase [Oscillospiraceae bacterium]
MKIAVLGGTFNPIHNGHLNIVDAVLQNLNPDKLIIMPTGTPPHKLAQDLVSDEDRLSMLKLAVADRENVTVSDYEMKQEGKSYTVLTMEHLSELYPEDELYFIMGSDMLFTFLKWFMPDRIMQLATLIGICRDEDIRKKDKESAQKIISAGGRCILINCPAVEVSSTEVRQKVKAGEDISTLVPESVAEYIKERGLYIND